MIRYALIEIENNKVNNELIPVYYVRTIYERLHDITVAIYVGPGTKKLSEKKYIAIKYDTIYLRLLPGQRMRKQTILKYKIKI